MKACSHWELRGEQGKLSRVSFGFWSDVCAEKAFRGNEKNAKKGYVLLVGQINLWVWSACLNDQSAVDLRVQPEPDYHFKKLTQRIYFAPATCWPPCFHSPHLLEMRPELMEMTPRKSWSLCINIHRDTQIIVVWWKEESGIALIFHMSKPVTFTGLLLFVLMEWM